MTSTPAPEQTTAVPRRRITGKSLVLGALVALNAVLAVMFVTRQVPEQTANAQAGRPSDFLMVPGSVNGVSTGVVFIVDTSTGQLSAVTYNDTRDALTPLPKIDLNQVFRAGAGVGVSAPGKGPKPR